MNHMNSPSIIQDIQINGTIPKLACLFVSHVDGAHRHQDLTCSEDYAMFIVNDLLPWMEMRFPTADPTNSFIGGVSLSGLEAAYTALNHSNIFKYCLCQSGSFWWNSEYLTESLKEFARSNTRFWLSVGDEETAVGVSHPPSGIFQGVTQIDACTRFAEALDQKNIPVHHHLYSGGHACAPWSAEITDALTWLLIGPNQDLSK